jgi:very-short-patch-repair endonuclease
VPGARIVDLELRRPFTSAQALAAGVSPSSLKGSRFRCIFRGVHIHASVPPHPLLRVAAALLIHPADAFASHTSAGRVYGVPLPVLPDEHVSVFRQQDRRRRSGLRPHAVSPGTAVVVVRGLRVSAAAQMFVELGEILGLVDLVVVGDDLVRQKRLSPEELRAFCATSTHPGARRARQAGEYVRTGVDSPMESRLRMLIVLAGLPEPTVNFKVYDAVGRLLYRFDLSYPDLKILVEYDGRQHRDDLVQWDHDSDRNDWFVANGWRHVPVFSRGIYRDPAKTLRRVEAALRERGATLPRRLRDDWQAHFPGH